MYQLSSLASPCNLAVCEEQVKAEILPSSSMTLTSVCMVVSDACGAAVTHIAISVVQFPMYCIFLCTVIGVSALGGTMHCIFDCLVDSAANDFASDFRSGTWRRERH